MQEAYEELRKFIKIFDRHVGSIVTLVIDLFSF